MKNGTQKLRGRTWSPGGVGFLCATQYQQVRAFLAASGAVLPGVEVKVTNTDTTATRTVLTNETGAYAVPNLSVGPYRLEAALPGFSTFVQSGIVLQVNSNPTINVVLQIGQVTEQVEVQANAAMVETHSNVIGQVI